MTPPMLRMNLLPSLFVVLLAAACGGGGDDDGTNVAPDAGEGNARPDASAGAADAAPEVTCSAVNDFSDLGAMTGQVYGSVADGLLGVDHTLEEGPPTDFLAVELYEGFAPFADGIVTGVFEISGENTAFETCGTCVVIYPNETSDSADPMVFVAQSGTVTVTSVDGNFTGSFAPAGASTIFQGFVIDPVTDEEVAVDGCTVTGGAATWDLAIPAPQ